MTTKTPSEVIAEFLETVLLPQKQQKNNLEIVYIQFRNLKAEIEKSFLTNKKSYIRVYFNTKKAKAKELKKLI